VLIVALKAAAEPDDLAARANDELSTTATAWAHV
jgi:hypothetical protein